LPYRLRHDPGPTNPLGRIKFVFPNAHTVYLHDTPSRHLFEFPERAASSGCIRVENAFELAIRLLDDPERWSPEALEREIATNRTQTVNLARPVPIVLVYWTVDFGLDGSVAFHRDLYDRDPALLRALDADFSYGGRSAS
jgi:murein L,D-transpeptidase YcbB/YkuD